MKTIINSGVIFILLLFVACEKSDLSNDNSLVFNNYLNGEKSAYMSKNEQVLPKIQFIKIEGKENVYSVKLFDENLPDGCTPEMKIEFTYPPKKGIDKFSCDVLFNANDVKNSFVRISELFETLSAVEGTIAEISLLYRKNDEIITSSTFKLIVLENGKTKLYAPVLSFTQWIDKGIILSNTSNEAILYLKLEKGGEVHEPEELNFTFKPIDASTKVSVVWNAYDATPQEMKIQGFSGGGRFMKCILKFAENPVGKVFPATIAINTIDGKPVIEPLTIDFAVIDANSESEIASFDILAGNNELNFEFNVLYKDIKKNQFEYALVEIFEENGEQKEQTLPITSILMKKRPELLYLPWKSQSNKYITETENIPILLPSGNSNVSLEEVFKLFPEKEKLVLFYVRITPYGKDKKSLGKPGTYKVSINRVNPMGPGIKIDNTSVGV